MTTTNKSNLAERNEIMIKNNVEILAPVSNHEMLKAAVFTGANAVYLGLTEFNARKSADNFTPDEIVGIVEFCHGAGVKVNIVLNTIIYSREIPQLVKVIKLIAEAGVDAVIVQDLATAFLCKKISPTLALHASTQLACTNLSGALQLQDMGFARVILARELSKKEIAHITQNCTIETEVFVHGAMCMGVSGQCYLSAFLGGRSGNRGECASPCRLPFTAREGVGVVTAQDGDFHLSLKDQSLVDYIPDLQEMGVACVKIEGRLRSAQYVAAAVNACVQVLNKEVYDKGLLQDIFSRSGFSTAYFDGEKNEDMFGVRSREENDLTRAAAPKLQELYRRQLQHTPITANVIIENTTVCLTVSDGVNRVEKHADCVLEPSKSDTFKQAVEKAVGKLGGTPFNLSSCTITVPDGVYIPLSIINELRRQAIQQLLETRSQQTPHETFDVALPAPSRKTVPATGLHARFSSPDQIPFDLIDNIDKMIFPIEQAHNIPTEIYLKVVLELPRGVFGDDSAVLFAIKDAIKLGFKAFEVNNIGQVHLLKNIENIEIYSGFAMNITNEIAAQALCDMGVSTITVSPETKLIDVSNIDISAKTGVLGYGFLPLMITRACPLHNITSCKTCNKTGVLRDRKGKNFTVTCTGSIRNIFNPIPIYMGDRQLEIFCDFVCLYFTNETAGKVREVCDRFMTAKPFNREFTRGLYY